MNFNKFYSILIAFIAMYFSSCSPNPVPIDYGKDECANCKMQLSDKKFGAEILTNTGKPYIFDSIECMSFFYLSNKIEKKQIHSFWVIDYSNPGSLLNAKNALFLKSNGVPSPMGLSLSAFSSKGTINYLKEVNDGVILKWEDIPALVQKEWHN